MAERDESVVGKVTTLLMFPRHESGCPRGLIQWLNGISSRYEGELSFSGAVFAFLWVESDEPASEDREQCPQVYEALCANVRGPFLLDDMIFDPHIVLQLDVCRQHGSSWTMLDSILIKTYGVTFQLWRNFDNSVDEMRWTKRGYDRNTH